MPAEISCRGTEALKSDPNTDAGQLSEKRLLLITKTDFTETVDGGTMRVTAIVEALRGAGFKVDWVAIRGGRSTTAHRPNLRLGMEQVRVGMRMLACRSLSIFKWYSPRAVAEIHGLRARNKYAATVIEYSQLLPYKPIVPHPVVVDMHNVEAELLSNYALSTDNKWKRALGNYESRRMQALEATIIHESDAVAVVSHRDREMILAQAGGTDRVNRVILASNGVADVAFDSKHMKDRTIVFMAHLGWRPNVDAAVWLALEVWPHVLKHLPDFRLQLVGRNPADEVLKLASDSIEVHANVPSAVEFVGRARVATAPLLAAGGTRLKILEGLACGTPVVATSLGALGLEDLAAPGVLEIADNPEQFAACIVGVISGRTDPQVIRRTVEPYRWERVLKDLVNTVESLSNETSPSRSS